MKKIICLVSIVCFFALSQQVFAESYEDTGVCSLPTASSQTNSCESYDAWIASNSNLCESACKAFYQSCVSQSKNTPKDCYFQALVCPTNQTCLQEFSPQSASTQSQSDQPANSVPTVQNTTHIDSISPNSVTISSSDQQFDLTINGSGFGDQGEQSVDLNDNTDSITLTTDVQSWENNAIILKVSTPAYIPAGTSDWEVDLVKSTGIVSSGSKLQIIKKTLSQTAQNGPSMPSILSAGPGFFTLSQQTKDYSRQITISGSNLGSSGTITLKNVSNPLANLSVTIPDSNIIGYWSGSQVTAKLPDDSAFFTIPGQSQWSVSLSNSEGTATAPQSITIDNEMSSTSQGGAKTVSSAWLSYNLDPTSTSGREQIYSKFNTQATYNLDPTLLPLSCGVNTFHLEVYYTDGSFDKTQTVSINYDCSATSGSSGGTGTSAQEGSATGGSSTNSCTNNYKVIQCTGRCNEPGVSCGSDSGEGVVQMCNTKQQTTTCISECKGQCSKDDAYKNVQNVGATTPGGEGGTCTYSQSCGNGGTQTCTGKYAGSQCSYVAGYTTCQSCIAPGGTNSSGQEVVCAPGDYKTQCTNQCGGCPSGSGEAKISQCNSAGTSYDYKYNQCSGQCAQYCGGGSTPTGPCTYPEACPSCAGGVHTCHGTYQNGVCKYDPSVAPDCQ